jgi:hypothetical protein
MKTKSDSYWLTGEKLIEQLTKEAFSKSIRDKDGYLHFTFEINKKIIGICRENGLCSLVTILPDCDSTDTVGIMVQIPEHRVYVTLSILKHITDEL